MRKLLQITGLFLIVALSALAFGPALINQDDVRARLQNELSTALARPVSIESIHIRLIPKPTVEISGFAVPLGETAQENLAFKHAYVELALMDLIQGKISINSLVIQQTRFSETLIAAIKRLFPNSGENTGNDVQLPLSIKTVRLKDFYWLSADSETGPFQIDAHWKDQPTPYLIEAVDQARSITLAITPRDKEWHFDLVSQNGEFPWALPLSLNSFRLSGYYQDKSIQFDLIKADGLESKLEGKGKLDWQSGWQLDLETATTSLDLPVVLASLGKSAIPGTTEGTCKIHMKSESANSLMNHADYQCDLVYQHNSNQSPVTVTANRLDEIINIQFQARDFIPPIGPALEFDSINVSGVLNQNRFTILDGHLEAYKGEASLTGEIDWTDELAIRFASRTTTLELEPVLATFEQHKLAGNLDSQCKGSLKGSGITAAREQMQLKCDFKIANGVVFDTDLEQAARFIGEEAPDQPKQTPFDTLSGKLSLQQGRYDFTNINITSSALAASGNLSISSNDELDGKLSVGLNKTGNILSVPLVVSGTTQEPSLMPTKSSMTGAGAGTLLLGPGIGTAIGAKIGEAVGNFTNLFRRKTETE